MTEHELAELDREVSRGMILAQDAMDEYVSACQERGIVPLIHSHWGERYINGVPAR